MTQSFSSITLIQQLEKAWLVLKYAMLQKLTLDKL